MPELRINNPEYTNWEPLSRFFGTHRTCIGCRRNLPRTDLSIVTDSNLIYCSTCRDTLSEQHLCLICSNQTNNQFVCDNCLNSVYIENSHCRLCDQEQPLIISQLWDNTFRLYTDGAICDDCANDAAYCDRCDTWYSYEYNGRCPDCQSSYCENCDNYYSGETCEACLLYDSQRPGIIFTHAPGETQTPKTLYLGIELELDYPSSAGPLGQQLRDAGLPAFVGYDGSLQSDKGIEIRTEPLSESWVLANKKTFKKAFKHINSYGFKDHNGTGLHIHLNKNAFEDKDHLYRFCKLLYENADHAETLAGRESSRWGTFRQESSEEIRRKTQDTREQIGRYVAINVTPLATNELRFFRATTNLNTFLYRVQFAIQAFRFTRDTTDKRKLTWANFVKSVKKTKFPELYNYLHNTHKVTKKKTKKTTVSVSTTTCSIPRLHESGLCPTCDTHRRRCNATHGTFPRRT